MPKFNWGAFLENFGQGVGKVAPEMFKDIRSQNITAQHYKDWMDIQRGTLQQKALENAYNTGLNTPFDTGWRPGDFPGQTTPTPSGIGGPVAAGQLGITTPTTAGSLNALEGTTNLEGGFARANPPVAGPPQPANTLQDVEKRIKDAADNPLEQQRLLGQKAQLLDNQRQEVTATLDDMNKSLRSARSVQDGIDAIEKTIAMTTAHRDRLVTMLNEAQASGRATPQQLNTLKNSIDSENEKIKVLGAEIVKTPATIAALTVDADRFAKMLIANGVDPDVIAEYRRAFAAGENIGWLGNKIVIQGSGGARVPKGRTSKPAPRPGYTPPRQ